MESAAENERKLSQMIVGSWVTQAVYVAAEIGIADLLGRGPRHVSESGST